MPLEALPKYTPTELEKIVESPCPFYIPRKRVFGGVYAPAHELATNLLAVKLQQIKGTPAHSEHRATFKKH